MGKVIRLTESELVSVIEKIVSEQTAFEKGQQMGQSHKQGLVKGVKKVGQAIADTAVQTVKLGVNTLKFLFVGGLCICILAGKAFSFAASLGQKVISFLGSLAKKIGGIIVSGFKKQAVATENYYKTASKNIAEFFTALFNSIKGLGMKAWAAALQLASNISEIWTHIKNWADKAWQGIKNKIGGYVDSAKKGIKQGYNTVKQGVQSAWNQASDMASGIGGYVSGFLSESELRLMLEYYDYYTSLPLKQCLRETYLDNRELI